MVAVVKVLQPFQRLVRRPAVHLSHLLHLRHEVVHNLLLGYSTNGGILRLETDVHQIVEHGEEGNLRKLGDTCDEDKAFHLVICLQDGKHLAIEGCAGFVLRGMPRVLKRRVILVDKYGYLLAGLVVGRLNNGIKPYSERGIRTGIRTIHLFIVAERITKIRA